MRALMNLHADIGAILTTGSLETGHKIVLAAVRYLADEHGMCRVTVDRLAELTSLSRPSVFRRMADLTAMQIIEKLAGFRDGSEYRVHVTRLTVRPHPSHSETPPVSHRDPTRLTVRPHPSHSETVRLIDVLCGSDVTAEQQEQRTRAAAAAAAPAHAHESPVDSGEVGGLIEAWWQTQPGYRADNSMAKGLIVPPAVQYSVLDLVKTHGPDRVRWAIAAAVEKTNRGSPSLGFMRKLAEEGPLADTPRRSFLSAPARPIGGVAITPPETAKAWEEAAQEEAARRESMPLCPSCNGESGDCGAWARASPAGPAWVCHQGRARDAEPYEIQMQAELRPAREWRNTGT